uniref:glycosyltransferase n=1 Tax=Synechococcus sp. CS-1329 TaxID=2847975 RepID=UPI002880334E|nr:glycosyltransferase [Synechococcus sp. CS-1329]
MAMGLRTKPAGLPRGVAYVHYSIRRGNTKGIHPLAVETESKMLRAEACAHAAHQLAGHGFNPELICAHPGWGEPLFLRDVWPSAQLLTYQEFFYHPQDFDVGFDPEFGRSDTWFDASKVRMKNGPVLLSLEASHWSVTPTQFQLSSFPQHWHSRFSVIHDGIDTEVARPAEANQGLTLKSGLQLPAGTPLVTFVNRSLEPYRGCHSFIRSIPELQRLNPEAEIVMVGAQQGVSYGRRCASGEWHEQFFAEIDGQYDPAKVHLTGPLPYPEFIQLLQRSSAHVYLTYPFVLSWSLMEAMSCACAIVGSATPPVQELIEDGRNGLLVDFFQPRAIAEAVAELLQKPAHAHGLGAAARQTIQRRYSLNICLPQHRALIELVAQRAFA